jgi:hypothetical protein
MIGYLKDRAQCAETGARRTDRRRGWGLRGTGAARNGPYPAWPISMLPRATELDAETALHHKYSAATRVGMRAGSHPESLAINELPDHYLGLVASIISGTVCTTAA